MLLKNVQFGAAHRIFVAPSKNGNNN